MWEVVVGEKEDCQFSLCTTGIWSSSNVCSAFTYDTSVLALSPSLLNLFEHLYHWGNTDDIVILHVFRVVQLHQTVLQRQKDKRWVLYLKWLSLVSVHFPFLSPSPPSPLSPLSFSHICYLHGNAIFTCLNICLFAFHLLAFEEQRVTQTRNKHPPAALLQED